MHQLSRLVRFAINPFLDGMAVGANSYCAKPVGEGLAICMGLWVELTGSINPDTGFVVNVVDIDKIVRNTAVSMFDEYIKEKYRKDCHISCENLAVLLQEVSAKLSEEFAPLKLEQVWLELAPNRKLGIKTEDADMMYFGEKFEFAASHKLWNDRFSDEENFEAFGKCANPAGHGHNYIVEVVVKKATDETNLETGRFEQIVNDGFIKMVDHKNLNVDVEHFLKVNPTVENIAEFVFKNLDGKFGSAKLDNVTVWESSRTFCSYRSD
ncbi:MAG: 6-carboxytetrahydropterin synthase [Anaerohalosphaeraceae bacterium]|nr:6-carboxytetrahydropterin synthase [Anaerohalosphaeraceae bacterium]